jgi:hypothetical protein
LESESDLPPIRVRQVAEWPVSNHGRTTIEPGAIGKALCEKSVENPKNSCGDAGLDLLNSGYAPFGGDGFDNETEIALELCRSKHTPRDYSTWSLTSGTMGAKEFDLASSPPPATRVPSGRELQIAAARARGVSRRSHLFADIAPYLDFLGCFRNVHSLRHRSSTPFRR